MSASPVAVLVDYYHPGFKGGGSLKAIARLVEVLGDEAEFHVLTRDRDLGDTAPYPGLTGGPMRQGNAMVKYFAPGCTGLRDLRATLCARQWSVLYLNSAFSARYTLLPLLLARFGLLRAARTIVAPRGEFSPGALAVRAAKKRWFLRAARLLGVYRAVTWQASNEMESGYIRGIFGARARVILAPELPALADARVTGSAPPKASGTLSAVFLSRISPKKNLDGALDLLREVRGTVTLDIYGTLEDSEYWEKCQRAMAGLPGNVTARYKGPLEPQLVSETLARYHLFLFPTHGENYGYVVHEALLAGCPVFISDQTPWGIVAARNAGSVVSLGTRNDCIAQLQNWIDLGHDEMAVSRLAAAELGRELSCPAAAIAAARAMFGLHAAPAAGAEFASPSASSR